MMIFFNTAAANISNELHHLVFQIWGAFPRIEGRHCLWDPCSGEMVRPWGLRSFAIITLSSLQNQFSKPSEVQPSKLKKGECSQFLCDSKQQPCQQLYWLPALHDVLTAPNGSEKNLQVSYLHSIKCNFFNCLRSWRCHQYQIGQLLQPDKEEEMSDFKSTSTEPEEGTLSGM